MFRFSCRSLALLALLLFFAFAADAQTNTWVPANPARVVPTQLSVYSCSGQTTVNARWMFGSTGYRVVQTPVVSRSGQTISLDARVEEWTGVSAQMIVSFEKNFDIGQLEPGTYTLDFKSWGSTLKQIQFTVMATPPAGQSIDAPCVFVAQHYRDFLSRENDAPGMAYWTREIAQCEVNPQCIEVQRINVSASFLLSIEFNETGYYVYRMYRGALGRPPAFAEFVPDSAQVGRNVIVGSNDPWQARLNSNKDAYATQFFNRPDFQARYAGLTTAQYIDRLFETEGITPTQAERDELIDSIDRCSTGCPTRATVLRRIIEHPGFHRRIANEAFVTLQYFGYLRRDPDAAGFQFWLDKLNQFHGNFIEAEMVKAFITSEGYRQRF
jgi:hypothetical protein